MVWLKSAWEEGKKVGEETECVTEKFVEEGEWAEEERDQEWWSLGELIGLGHYPRGEVFWRGASSRSSIIEEGFL